MERHEEKLGESAARVFPGDVGQRHGTERRFGQRQAGRGAIVSVEAGSVEVGCVRLDRREPSPPRVARQGVVAGDTADTVVERAARGLRAALPERGGQGIDAARFGERHLLTERREVGSERPDHVGPLGGGHAGEDVRHRRAGGRCSRVGEELRQPGGIDPQTDPREVRPRLRREILVGRAVAGGAAELADEQPAGTPRWQMAGARRRNAREPLVCQHGGRRGFIRHGDGGQRQHRPHGQSESDPAEHRQIHRSGPQHGVRRGSRRRRGRCARR